MLAQSSALATATSQGAASGSALQGAYGTIQGRGTTDIVGVNQNQQLGNAVFAANRQAAQGAATASLGGALQTVGGGILQNRQTISSVGSYLFGQ